MPLTSRRKSVYAKQPPHTWSTWLSGFSAARGRIFRIRTRAGQERHRHATQRQPLIRAAPRGQPECLAAGIRHKGMGKLLPVFRRAWRVTAFAVEKGVVCALQDHRTTFAPQGRRRKPPLWPVLVAICLSPVLIALAMGLLVIRILVLLFLLYMLGQVYGLLLGLLWPALGQLFSPPGLLTLAASAVLYWLLRRPPDPPAQPKG
jgi:hypothetical protein